MPRFASAPRTWPSRAELPVGFGEMVPCAYFAREAPRVARDLLGTLLLSRAGGTLTGGRIVETEAYLGSEDPGSHASTRGITDRNRVMFGPPGCTYVYFTYGNHHMLNLVTDPEGVAGAVLVRAIEPLVGIETMRQRRVGRKDAELTDGPGKLAAALGLALSDNAGTLGEGSVAVFEGDLAEGERAGTSGRVGLSAGYDLPLRYYIEGNAFVSNGRVGPPRARMRSRRD